MPFNSYASASDVARAHRIRLLREDFIEPMFIPVHGHVRADVEFTLRDSLYQISEAAVCESLIYPILREVWRPYLADLTLWSHYPLNVDCDL